MSNEHCNGCGCVKPDNVNQVFFYEKDFYVLSNFSAFKLIWDGNVFDTSEAAYHWMRFKSHPRLQYEILHAMSAHEAFRFAQDNKHLQDAGWDDIKVHVMRNLLREKAAQHEYVRRKLLATSGRKLIEDSWRDDFWGWGPKRDGQNMLGKLWMEIRAELEALGSMGRDRCPLHIPTTGE